MTRPHPLSRRACIGLLSRTSAALLSAFSPLPLLASSSGKTPNRASFAESLDLALVAMETGKHPEALAPLRSALMEGRNEPVCLLALGTLYLHAGSSSRAAHEFARVRLLSPTDSLALWGESLALLAQGRRDVDLRSIAPDVVPAAPLLAEYLRLVAGEASAVRTATDKVTENEADLLLLEIAGFAALRGGDPERGEALLKALLERHEMRALAEDRAIGLSFLANVPVQGTALALKTALELPEPKGNMGPLSGGVTLTPPSPLPYGTAMVLYTVDGAGGFSASTNNAPYISEWNSARFPNGQYVIRATAADADGRELGVETRAIAVVNPNAPVSSLLSDGERKAFQERLLRLLTPRPSRKAAHYALAERATKQGDSQAALDHMEAVVAIDPHYNNALTSLRQYNTATVGASTSIWCGLTDEKIVALTFDDGPKPDRTPFLLDVLKKEGATATFFVVGSRAETMTNLLVRMDTEGHEIANHSYTHSNLTFLSNIGVTRELCRTSVIIREATGKRPRFFRPPGGNINSAVSATAETLGLSGAYWTADGFKFELEPFTPDDLARYVLSKIRPGAIVLLHNAPANTVAAIPQIMQGLRARGYTTVTMGELMRRCRPGTAHHAGVKPQSAKE